MVYYIPKKSAIDIFEGRSHFFMGDPAIYQQPLLIKNYLDPTRTLFRASLSIPPSKTIIKAPFIFSAHKKILVVNATMNFNNLSGMLPVDLVIVSGGPTIRIKQLFQMLKFQTIVFDCSNPLWKIEQWKKEDNKIRRKIAAARERLEFTSVPDAVLERAAALCMKLGTDGLRGELTLMRAARAYAAIQGAKEVMSTHLKAVATMALRHRLRRNPLDDTGSGVRVERAITELFSA